MATPALCGVMCIARIHTARQLLEAVRHNKRERLQPHIDPGRVSRNYALAGPTVGQNVSQTITHTARAMLRAAGLGNGPNLKPLRKNVVYAVEIIFSLPPGFSTKNIRAYFHDCLAWMGRYFCDFNNILSADVHLDESAPHMHVLVLPLVEGRMQGGKMCGSPAQFNKWRESLYAEVGIRFGLSRPAQQLRGEDKAQAITMVLAHYQQSFPDLLNDPAWPVMRKAIERDPLPYVQKLGLEVAPHQKQMRTMAQIFTSKGKGPTREPGHAQRVTASTKTLCSVAIDKIERVDEAPVSKGGDAVGTMAEKPKARTKKTVARGDMVLTQDCIDGYSETGSDSGKDTKAPFLKETRNYLNAVADALRAFGYEPHPDRKGSPEKPVSVNESGTAGSGDVTLTMRHPETGNNAYITIGDTTLRGMVPSTRSGIAVMYRVGGGDRYATKAGNTWAPVDLSANDLAALVHSSARPAQAAPNSTRENANGNQIEAAGDSGNRALEGAPAQEARSPETGGDAEPGGAEGSGNDSGRTGQPDRAGIPGGSGVGNGAGDVPVSTGRGRGQRGSPGQRGVQAEPVPEPADARPVGEQRQQAINDAKETAPAGDYRITDLTRLSEGGQKTKYRNNVAAIQLLNELQATGRQASVGVSNVFCSIAEFMRQSRGQRAALLVDETCNLPIDFEKNLGADMGGAGSGRRLDSTRRKTSQAEVLDVRALQRKGLLQPGYQVQWTDCAADGTARINHAVIKPDKIVVSRFSLIATDHRVLRRDEIALEWTACHLGGKRPWFRCPTPGCGRRVACLYPASSGAYSCRRCQGLVYEVQYEKPAFRLMTKADKIRCKLGWGPGIANPTGDKPKGMHWHTFWHLALRHDRIALGAFGLMQAQLRGKT